MDRSMGQSNWDYLDWISSEHLETWLWHAMAIGVPMDTQLLVLQLVDIAGQRQKNG